MSGMGIKRTGLDGIVSDLVRERANWICEACGLDYKHERIQMQCCHIVGRRITRLRHDGMNLVAMCASCHANFSLSPLAFAAFVREKIGEANADWLERMRNTVHKRPKGWEKEARKHYRAELKAMKAKRLAGDDGYIDFVSYW